MLNGKLVSSDMNENSKYLYVSLSSRKRITFIFSWFFSHYWLEFFPEKELPFFPIYLFIQLVIAVWTLGVYFLGYNRKLSLFCCSDYSAWVTGHSLWWGPGPSPIPDPFWALPYFLAPQDFSGLSSIFPASDSDIGQFFHWRLDGIAIFVVFQNEGLGGWVSPWQQGVLAPGPSQCRVGNTWCERSVSICLHRYCKPWAPVSASVSNPKLKALSRLIPGG